MPDGKQKKQKSFRMTETAIKHIEEMSETWGVDYTTALERIIREHREREDSQLDAIADAVINKFDSKYGKAITRIRMSSNYTDRNVQIMLEAFNSLLYDLNIGEYLSFFTNPHSILMAGTRNVQENLANYRNRTTSSNSKGGNIATY